VGSINRSPAGIITPGWEANKLLGYRQRAIETGILRAIAKCCQLNCRNIDILGRYGGEVHDLALYAAKHDGRNRFYIYSDDHSIKFHADVQTIGETSKKIKEDFNIFT
jgi:hypothetical protein